MVIDLVTSPGRHGGVRWRGAPCGRPFSCDDPAKRGWCFRVCGDGSSSQFAVKFRVLQCRRGNSNRRTTGRQTRADAVWQSCARATRIRQPKLRTSATIDRTEAVCLSVADPAIVAPPRGGLRSQHDPHDRSAHGDDRVPAVDGGVGALRPRPRDALAPGVPGPAPTAMEPRLHVEMSDPRASCCAGRGPHGRTHARGRAQRGGHARDARPRDRAHRALSGARARARRGVAHAGVHRAPDNRTLDELVLHTADDVPYASLIGAMDAA